MLSAIAFRMGGPGYDVSTAIAVDGAGNVYTAGYFQGTADFDPGAGVFNLTSAGSYDVFVSKLDSAGNFVWAQQLGGSSFDVATGIAVDGAGNVYTTGGFQGTADFDPGAGVFNLTSAGQQDIFVSKLDSAGNFVWAQQMAGSEFNNAFGIALDGAGNVYTTGGFLGTADFDPGVGVFNLTSSGGFNGFVSKLDGAGNFLGAAQLASGGGGGCTGIAVDSTDNVYTTGHFYFTADFDPGPGTFNLTSAGLGDVFVSKLPAATGFPHRAPTISSNGGGVTASVSVAENTMAVTTVTALTDGITTLTFSIAGGADAGQFSIDSGTGVLTFISPPNYENPTAAGRKNVYNVIVEVTDSDGLFDTQAIAVTVTDVNEAPVISSPSVFTIAENKKAAATVGKVVAKDPDTKWKNSHGSVQTLTYSIQAQTDAGDNDVAPLFAIDSAKGKITVASPLDYEVSDHYTLVVRATDSLGLSTDQMITVNVTGLNEKATFILQDTTPATVASLSISKSAVNNGDAIGRVMATDLDAGAAGAVNYVALSGAFSIDPDGTIRIADKTKLKVGAKMLTVSEKDGSLMPLTSKFKFTINVSA